MVMISGVGGKAFCAGGDVKAVYRAGMGLPGADKVIL